MSAEKTSKPGMFAPRYLATWLYIGLLYLISWLPLKLQYVIGRQLGRFLYTNRRLQHIARTNITRCLPELDTEQTESLIRKYFENQGIDLIETMYGWAGDGLKITADHQIEGIEHVKAALQQDRGIILLGSHFSNVDLGCMLLVNSAREEKLFEFSALYREQKNPVFDWFMKRGRLKYIKQAIPANEIRPILRELKKKKIVWFAPDMDVGDQNSTFAPFMGIQASTTTAISRLAAMTNAIVIPYANYRTEGRFQYKLKYFPPMADFPSDDEVADATRLNQFVEQLVREKPESYLWILRRFKTRPPGEAPFY